MTYDVEVEGRVRHVSVQREAAGFAVVVDGRELHVDAARLNPTMMSLLVSARPAAESGSPGAPDTAASYEISIVSDVTASQLVVSIEGAVVRVGMNGRRRWGRREEGGTTGGGPQRVVAPMPGKIVRVLVQSGEAVRPRQPLVVVEAMKMENELRAIRDGTVAEMHAHEGQSVEAGALLVVIQ